MLFTVKQDMLNWHFIEGWSEKWARCYYTELPSHLSRLPINAQVQNNQQEGHYNEKAVENMGDKI